MLERFNDKMLQYDDTLRNEISPQYRSLASTAGSGLKQALMKTDLSESVQDSQVMAIHPTGSVQIEGVVVDFFVQMKEQQDEEELKGKLMKSLEATNFILGDSEIIASRFTDSLQAQGKSAPASGAAGVLITSCPLASDFDECSHEGHHDCSEFAECINERGTFRCQCRSGFVDSADETGRICLGTDYILRCSIRFSFSHRIVSIYSRTPGLRGM